MAEEETISTISRTDGFPHGEPQTGAFGATAAGYGPGPTGEPVRVLIPSPASPVARPEAPHQLRRTTRHQARPEDRAAVRTHWRAACNAASLLLAAAGQGDPAEVTLQANRLDEELERLWALRAVREVDWQTILNHAQGMMRQMFHEKVVEGLTPAQCRNILTLVENYLGTGTKDTEDLNEAVRVIEDAGFDPYYAISGDPAAE